jgi:hypothetical protein
MSTVDKAIRNAAYILGEIDKKWPNKAPAPFANSADARSTGGGFAALMPTVKL